MNKQIDSLSKGSTEPAAPVIEEVTSQPVEEPVAPQTESFENMFPEPNLMIAGPPNWVWWAVLVAASAVLGLVGYTLARQNIGSWLATSTTATPAPTVNATTVPTATPTAVATATPAPTATPVPTTVVASDVSLRVLNGTTAAGAAGVAAKTLKTAGFTVRTTGNAKNQTYTSTYVYYQKGKDAEGKLVAAALKDYSPVLEESTLADPDNVLVVIGK